MDVWPKWQINSTLRDGKHNQDRNGILEYDLILFAFSFQNPSVNEYSATALDFTPQHDNWEVWSVILLIN